VGVQAQGDDFVIGILDDGSTISLEDNSVTGWVIADAAGVALPVPTITGTLPPRWAFCRSMPAAHEAPSPTIVIDMEDGSFGGQPVAFFDWLSADRLLRAAFVAPGMARVWHDWSRLHPERVAP
jgi:hypothetical protein